MSDSRYGVFGRESNYISSYALISSYSCSETEVENIVGKLGGFYIDLNDGENHGVIFNLTTEQMISVAISIGCSAFIYGSDETPSKPVYYVRSSNDNIFTSNELSEFVMEFDDLEVIAPKYNALWTEVYFNDYFRECLFSVLESEEMEDDEEE